MARWVHTIKSWTGPVKTLPGSIHISNWESVGSNDNWISGVRVGVGGIASPNKLNPKIAKPDDIWKSESEARGRAVTDSGIGPVIIICAISRRQLYWLLKILLIVPTILVRSERAIQQWCPEEHVSPRKLCRQLAVIQNNSAIYLSWWFEIHLSGTRTIWLFVRRRGQSGLRKQPHPHQDLRFQRLCILFVRSAHHQQQLYCGLMDQFTLGF